MGKHRAPDDGGTDFDAATSALEDVTGDYTVDVTHTRIGIRARHAMVTTVRGAFTEFSGTAHLDPVHPAASSVTLLADGVVVSRCAVPENSVKAPRTVVTIACRARMPMRVCATSTV